MSCPFGSEAIGKLKHFIEVCKTNANVLHVPELSFFKEYIESLGGKLPVPSAPPSEPAHQDEEPDESDLELDTEGCVEPDKLDDSQKMGDPAKEVTEDDSDKSNEIRVEAMSAFASNNYDKALALLTEAIELNPQNALQFAKRGQVYAKLNKPIACIKDCSRALELNPDSALAFKFRGRAYRLLGEWEKAARDLRQACIIDFDEQIDEWLKEVTPNAKRIEEHKLKQERKKAEKVQQERLERAQKAREARAEAAPDSQQATPPPPPPEFANLFKDPELLEALKDPEIAEAFKDISTNPMNFFKYQSNPKIMSLMNKMLSKSGMGFPGGAAGFPGAADAPPTGDEPKFTAAAPDDDNLD